MLLLTNEMDGKINYVWYAQTKIRLCKLRLELIKRAALTLVTVQKYKLVVVRVNLIQFKEQIEWLCHTQTMIELIIQRSMAINSLLIRTTSNALSPNVSLEKAIVEPIILVEFILMRKLHLEYSSTQISQLVGWTHFVWFVKIKMSHEK
jgi:hypothetical protein